MGRGGCSCTSLLHKLPTHARKWEGSCSLMEGAKPALAAKPPFFALDTTPPHLLCPSPKQMCNIEGPPQAMFIKHQPNNLKYLSWKLLSELLGMAVLSLAAAPDHSWWTEPWEAPWGICEPNTHPTAAQHDSPTPPSCATSEALIPGGTTSLSSNHDKKH